MAGKTLSNGTLSLRFMQNASRAKQLATAELEQAKIKDEAEWEVPAHVRATWGTQPREESTTQETSYIPFLFDDDTAESSSLGSSSTSRWRGRRAFDGKGQEVIVEQKPPPEETDATAADSKDWSKGEKRPVTISGSTGTVFIASKDKTAAKLSGKTKSTATTFTVSAQNMIRSGGDVGTDLRTARASRSTVPTKPVVKEEYTNAHSDDVQTRAAAFLDSVGFMKPAGVDMPTAGSKRANDSTGENDGKKKKKTMSED